MPTRVLLLLPTRTYRAAAFLDAAARLGAEVVVGSDQGSSLGHLMGGRELVVDLDRPDEAAGRAVELAAEHPLDAVVGVDEAAVRAAAVVAARLGLRHSGPEAVAATRDKRLLRAALDAAGVGQPAFRAVEATPAAALDAAGELGYPVVVKPVDLAGSRGVIRADGPAELGAAVERVARMLASDPACAGEGTPPLLVERFCGGPEVAVEGLLDGGGLRILAVFDKPDPLDGPFFEETLYVTPSRLGAADLAAVERRTGEAVAALGLTEGPIHAELRLPAPGAPVVIEVAARSIGGRCSSALRFAGGVTLEELILRQALGLPLGDPVLEGAAGVLMLPIERGGRLVAVEGLERARAVPGVESLAQAVPGGERLVPLPEGDRYLGFAVARAATAAAVEEALRRAWKEIHVVVAEDAATGVDSSLAP
ncbi:MAG TPA: ATP-grasp domain-containing protein [Candidatus Dormibacteraeota bacterium]|jgi:biotin carboxylase|nr:ATP-grasp domain-containing protein [Candidatus Dormibacteraeota bacterium]